MFVWALELRNTLAYLLISSLIDYWRFQLQFQGNAAIVYSRKKATTTVRIYSLQTAMSSRPDRLQLARGMQQQQQQYAAVVAASAKT